MSNFARSFVSVFYPFEFFLIKFLGRLFVETLQKVSFLPHFAFSIYGVVLLSS